MSDTKPAPEHEPLARIPTAGEIISLLDLKPHPEGGYYRETHRDEREHDGRSVATAIYFLLPGGRRSHWHRIDAAEVWHYYAGAALKLDVFDGTTTQEVRLGPEIAAGERPQAVVPAKAWQAAESTGEWTLVGCSVAPGFDFKHFEMAPPDWSPGI